MSGKKVEKKEFCAWCKYNPHDCDGCEEKCDFRSLKFEKGEIVERLREELGKNKLLVDELVGKNISQSRGKELLKDVQDRVVGMQIMTDRLEKSFGMTKEEIEKAIGVEKVGFMKRSRLAMKIYMLKNAR